MQPKTSNYPKKLRQEKSHKLITNVIKTYSIYKQLDKYLIVGNNNWSHYGIVTAKLL